MNSKLSRTILTTLIAVLSTLACGVSSQIPPEVLLTDTVLTPETSTEANFPEMVVVADTLHIRDAPNGQVLKPYLVRGQKVTIFDREIQDGLEWCKIGDRQWVACWWLKDFNLLP